MKKIFLTTVPERVFHWINAFCFVLLMITGFEIHFGAFLTSMKWAIVIHDIVGLFLTAEFMVWLLYYLFSFRIRNFILGKEDGPTAIWIQIKFYLFGIFQGKEHPTEPSPQKKFNPLQKLTYCFIMFIISPLQIVTGLYLYVSISKWMTFDSSTILIWSYVHVAGAFLGTAFLICHIYMATTGHRLFDNFKMMFTGYLEIPMNQPQLKSLSKMKKIAS